LGGPLSTGPRRPLRSNNRPRPGAVFDHRWRKFPPALPSLIHRIKHFLRAPIVPRRGVRVSICRFTPYCKRCPPSAPNVSARARFPNPPPPPESSNGKIWPSGPAEESPSRSDRTPLVNAVAPFPGLAGSPAAPVGPPAALGRAGALRVSPPPRGGVCPLRGPGGSAGPGIAAPLRRAAPPSERAPFPGPCFKPPPPTLPAGAERISKKVAQPVALGVQNLPTPTPFSLLVSSLRRLPPGLGLFFYTEDPGPSC